MIRFWCKSTPLFPIPVSVGVPDYRVKIDVDGKLKIAAVWDSPAQRMKHQKLSCINHRNFRRVAPPLHRKGHYYQMNDNRQPVKVQSPVVSCIRLLRVVCVTLSINRFVTWGHYMVVIIYKSNNMKGFHFKIISNFILH